MSWYDVEICLSNSDHKMQYDLVLLIIIIRMRKKDSSGSVTVSYNILYKVTSQCFERKNIDSSMISAFNNFIFNFADAFAKNNPTVANLQNLKQAVELINIFQANLAQDFGRHTCTIDDIVSLFTNLIVLAEKIQAAWKDPQKFIYTDIINVFSFFLDNKQEQTKLPPLDKKIQILNSVIQSHEIHVVDRLSVQFLIKGSFSFVSFATDNKEQLKNMFACYLRHPNHNEHFKLLVLRYLNQCVASNHLANFKKAITIFQHFGSTYQQRRSNIQIQTLKLLQCNNSFNFIVEINQLFNFSKLFSYPGSIRAVVKTVEKIIEKPNNNSQTTKILQQLSQLDLAKLPNIPGDKFDLKLETFLAKIIDWLINQGCKKENDQAEVKPKIQAEQKEDKLIQFVKKLSNKPEIQENSLLNQQLKKICSSFGKILKNLIKTGKFSGQLANLTVDSFPLLRNSQLTNEIVKSFIIDVMPNLIRQFDLNFKSKSSLIYAIVLRKAQLESQRVQQDFNRIVEKFYRQAYFQMLHAQSLNYHFMAFFIFLKYMGQKDYAISMILGELISDLQRPMNDKNNRNLILNMAFLLKILYPNSNFLPVKFKTRQLMKNIDNLSQKLDVSQILTVCSKQISISKANIGAYQEKCKQLYKLLNEQLRNYTRDNAGIFYSLVIGVSDMIEKQNIVDLQGKSYLLLEIKFIRKVNFLTEMYTLARSFIQKVKLWEEEGLLQIKKISGFLLLCKMMAQTRSKPLDPTQDLGALFQKLKYYLIAINSNINYKLLVTIDHFKNNKNHYREQKFIQYLSSKDFIKFYSQASQDQNQTHILLMKNGLRLIRKIMQVKKIPFSTLQDQIQILFLIYLFEESPSEFAFTERHELHLKQYILLLLLDQKMRLKQDITTILERLQVPVVKELTLEKHGTSLVSHFKNRNPFSLVDLCLKAVLNMFKSFDKQDALLFRFLVSLVEDDKKNHCLCLSTLIQKSIQGFIKEPIVSLIIKRVHIGLQLQESKKAQFLSDSSSLYHLIGGSLDNIHLEVLVQDIVQIDYYSQCERSAFLLKEIANIFSLKLQKKTAVCQTIFNYIITLTQIFPGQQKLQIANFICNFFGLQSSNKESNLQGLQKNVELQCNTQFNYKCLKCDDKRLICLACSLTCHKDHPVCFLSIPPEIKISRCQCRQIPGCCTLSKEVSGQNRKRSQLPQMNHYSPSYLVGNRSDFFERIKYPSIRQNVDDPAARFEYNQFIQQQEFDRMQNELIRSNKFYDSLMKNENEPKLASGMDRLFDRDQFPGHAYRAHIDRNRAPGQTNPLLLQKEKQSLNEDQSNIVEPQFIDEQYEKTIVKKQAQHVREMEQNTEILKKYALLPKFIQLMINFCSKKAIKDKNVSNLQLWSPIFNNPVVQKMMQVSVRVINAGSFHLQVRRQNPLNNVSCVLIKRNLAFNNRFVIIASGTDLLVYSKEKLLILASQAKVQGFNNIHRHSISYEIHSVQFSPVDKNLFCASGLHNLALFTMSNEGGIGRTQNRYNVNNLYINKIKLTKMGIFVGVDKEIRVLNYTCKHTLTIKAQEANTLIREWSIYQKAAGCQVYFVCPNGNIFFADVLPSDQGKKDFTGRINDQRKNKSSTGASVFVKDLPDIGKQLFASFKDGANILGRIQGDQMQNMTDIRLKGFKIDKNIFDNFFIVGHVDLVKLPTIDQVYLVCTLKKYFPPEMSFHQGFLAVIRMRKDGTSELQVLNDQSTCQTFQVFYISTKHFFILSLHTDGSLHLNSPMKIPRNIIQQEVKKSRQSEQNAAGNQNQTQPLPLDKIRKTIQKQILFQYIQRKNLSSSYLFRENTDNLKHTVDYVLTKLSQNEYELKQINFTKVVTGFSLPHFGNVQLPTRSLSKVFQIGFTNSQALYFFAQGTLRFKYVKSQSQKYTRQAINLTNNRMLEKIERIQRLHEYSQHERLLNANMITNFLNIKEDNNQEIIFVGRSFQNFKSKISKFDHIFTIESDQESSSIEKTALIIKMFLTQSLKQGHACDLDSILQLVNSIKSIVADANNKLFAILKQIIVVSMNVYQQQSGKKLNVFNDQNYGLKAATESRIQYFYNLLKLDIGDQELNEFLELLEDIIDEDLALYSFYCAKYPGIIAQIHRRLKRPDTQTRAQSIIKIYSLAYPILDYCKVPCAWMLSSITQVVYAFIKSKGVRESLYEGLRLSKYLVIEPVLRNLGNKDNELQDLQLLKNAQQGIKEDQAPKDPVTQIYMMFSRGQIDQDAMFRMIQDATKILYEKDQEVHEKPKQSQQMQVEEQKQMQEEVDHQLTLVYDLVDQCSDGFERDIEINLSRIVTLYVVSKVIDQHYQQLTSYLFDRIYKMVTEIDLKYQNQKLISVLSYSCLFNRIMTSSKTLKRERVKKHIGYRNIELQVNAKLSKIQFEKVKKISNPINLLPRIFRGQKPTPQAHIAYALANLLIYPCQPSHVLLSLQCYWLLPNSKESYSRQKCESSIRDGINSGNLIKVYAIAEQNAQIWQQSGEYLQFIERWIDQKKPNWQLALQLLAIYYQN